MHISKMILLLGTLALLPLTSQASQVVTGYFDGDNLRPLETSRPLCMNSYYINQDPTCFLSEAPIRIHFLASDFACGADLIVGKLYDDATKKIVTAIGDFSTASDGARVLTVQDRNLFIQAELE